MELCGGSSLGRWTGRSRTSLSIWGNFEITTETRSHEEKIINEGQDGRNFLSSAFSHNFTFLSRRALVITDTELKLIAAAAKIGLSSKPKNGYSTPAAMGTPMAL